MTARTPTVRLVQRTPRRQPATTQALAQRAMDLWPEAPTLQAEWVRAVLLVRTTRRGWLLDRPTPRAQP